MTDIHDIKPLLHIAGPWGGWLALVAGLILLAAGIWWLRRRRRASPGKAAAAARPAPHEGALAWLDALEIEAAGGKVFYFRLSEIIRRYIEERFDIPAAEMTLEELLPAIDRLPLHQDLARRLEGFCRVAEPIKFAAAPADPARMAEDLNFARAFVRRTAEDR
jgi:hypothetical protein